MSACKSALCKASKKSTKKFDNNKNKDKDYKLDKNKDFQSSDIQLKNKFKHSEYFDRKCNYCHKHEYKSQNCHKHF